MPKSLAMSSNGMDFDTFMKAIVKVPKEKLENSKRPRSKKKKAKR
ncbi:MAG: hypothetical protein ABSC63_13520 [Candidatus Binataceae bacterium]